ncbi:unnamed protein product [Paramecium sonneborni]|uniref:Uncharacterized protein n=1 Tax=Paramecium sonneborni TaxID=65129 RepID=A0A8S1RSM8_9CILI|nr:unnamed protein product [Paramecium sonneborni]
MCIIISKTVDNFLDEYPSMSYQDAFRITPAIVIHGDLIVSALEEEAFQGKNCSKFQVVFFCTSSAQQLIIIRACQNLVMLLELQEMMLMIHQILNKVILAFLWVGCRQDFLNDDFASISNEERFLIILKKLLTVIQNQIILKCSNTQVKLLLDYNFHQVFILTICIGTGFLIYFGTMNEDGSPNSSSIIYEYTIRIDSMNSYSSCKWIGIYMLKLLQVRFMPNMNNPFLICPPYCYLAQIFLCKQRKISVIFSPLYTVIFYGVIPQDKIFLQIVYNQMIHKSMKSMRKSESQSAYVIEEEQRIYIIILLNNLWNRSYLRKLHQLSIIEDFLSIQIYKQSLEIIFQSILSLDVFFGLNLAFIQKLIIIRNRKRMLINYFKQYAFVDLVYDSKYKGFKVSLNTVFQIFK